MKKNLILILFIIFCKAEAQTSALQIADSLYKIGNYKAAIEIYQKQPKTAENYQKIAQAYQAIGHTGLAITNYENAITQAENLMVAKTNLGKLYFAANRFDESKKIFLELSKKYPDNPDFYYRLGLAKEQLNDTTFFNDYKKVLVLDHSHQNALYQVAKVHFKKRNFQEVEIIAEQALLSYPENTAMIGLIAQNALAQKYYALSKNRFEQLLKLNKKTVFIHFNLGYCYYALEEYQKAYEQFKNVIELESNNQNAFLYAGKSLNHLERYQEAEKYLQMALLLVNQPIDDFYTQFALSLQKQEKFKEAIENYHSALSENPENYRAQYELAVCADNYYQDLQTKINYYQLFIDKFKEKDIAYYYVKLANARLSYLKQQHHLDKK